MGGCAEVFEAIEEEQQVVQVDAAAVLLLPPLRLPCKRETLGAAASSPETPPERQRETQKWGVDDVIGGEGLALACLEITGKASSGGLR